MSKSHSCSYEDENRLLFDRILFLILFRLNVSLSLQLEPCVDLPSIPALFESYLAPGYRSTILTQ